MKEDQSIKLEVTQVTNRECLNIVIGEKLSESYITHDATVSFFLSIGQLMDLYYQLDAEIERLGIDA
jgi:hypothetical protein